MKRLLFAAILAIVAISGAFMSANAVILYSEGESYPIDCFIGADITCAEQLCVAETTQVYLSPASEGSQGTPFGYAADYTYIP